MNPVARTLSKSLRPGFRLERQSGDEYYIISPDGQHLRNDLGQKILVGGADVPTSVRRLRLDLQKAGALDRPLPSKRRKHKPTVSPTEKPNFILISKEVLRDANATPRERRLAAECIRLVDANLALRGFSTQIALRLRAYEKD